MSTSLRNWSPRNLPRLTMISDNALSATQHDQIWPEHSKEDALEAR